MPRIAKALTIAAIRKAKVADKSIKLSDGGGMYLLLKPDGSRYWRLDYRFDGKRKTLALGVYPQVSLSDARARRAAARELLGQGVDPAKTRPGRQRKTAAHATGTPGSAGASPVPTERRRNMARATRRQVFLQTISRISELLMSGADERELMQSICDTLVNDGLFRMAWIGMVADDGVSVHSLVQSGMAEAYLDKLDIRCDESPQGQGPTGTAIRLGKTIINADSETNQHFALWREQARGLGFRSSAATPIRRQQRNIGALNVYSDMPQAFGADEVMLLEKLAADLGIAIERRAAERALRESEAKFRLLLEASPEAIFGVNTQGVCTFVNPACLHMLGYTREEDLVGKSMHPLIHHTSSDGRPYPKEQCNIRLSTLGGQSTHVDDELHWRADGSSFPVEYWSHPMYRDGELVGAVVNFIDITERKQAEQALRESEERYRLISSVATDLLYSCLRSTDGTFVIDWATVTADRVFGYSLQEILDQGCWRCYVHPDDLPNFDENITELQPGQASECDLRIIAKDGSMRYLRAYSRVADAEAPGSAAVATPHRLYGAVQDVTERMLAKERIQFLAHHDALTGLPNRILLRDRFEQALHYAERGKARVAMLFLDLDNFKIVNDTLGHATGDSLLQALVSRISRCVRETDTVSRQGGDEFILLLNDIPDIESVERVANAILGELAEPIEIEGRILNTSCSIGVSLYPEDGHDFDTLMQKADAAMYNAKEAGRSTYRFFNEEMNLSAHEHLLLQNRLYQALTRGEFSLVYQPQLELGTGRVFGVEALLRWYSPELGHIPPGRFIRVAEDSGIIVPIGAWVLQEACRQVKAWQAAGLPELSVAVNLSALQFRRGNLIETVASALRESGIAPHLLELELTESILLQDVEHTLTTVRQLKALGVRLSIDDFGTGYSSLSYLKRFTVDKLKIDQSFVRDISTDPDDAAIVRAIIQLANSLRLGTIAEGVETTEQLEFLQREGCLEIQGYFFSHPLAAENLRAFLLSHEKTRPQ